jgi:hypothetical protein
MWSWWCAHTHEKDYAELFTIRSNEKTMTPTSAICNVSDFSAATNREELAAFDDYYVAETSKLLRDFDKNIEKYGRRILASHYGEDQADTILKENHREYEALIPKIPYVGGKKNPLETYLIQSAWALALYRALKNRGRTAEETGSICYEMIEAQVYSYPRLLRDLVGRWYFARYRSGVRKGSAESQRRLYPEDWVWSFIQGDGREFDFGMDMTECAICKFFHAQGADQLTPHLCRTDFAVSKALGMGLVRTTTLAEGGAKCDFRYKRRRATKQGGPITL